MKIDEASIDHNIVECIKALTLSDTMDKDMDDVRLYLTGYIDGLVTLGEQLKTLLKI